MTTSADQRKRKLPEHSRVRRRLFEDIKDEAATDNFTNILQESFKMDSNNMMKKYNFDFKREVPLEGPWEWYYRKNDTWIGMKPTVFDDFVPIEKENQMTPRILTVDAPPDTRKRKRDGVLSDKGARRKISFE